MYLSNSTFKYLYDSTIILFTQISVDLKEVSGKNWNKSYPDEKSWQKNGYYFDIGIILKCLVAK